MQDFVTRLNAARSANPPNPDEVKRLLAELEAQVPDPAVRLKILTDGMLVGPAQPTDSAGTGSNFLLKGTGGIVTTIVTLGGTVIGSPHLNDLKIDVSNQFVLLAIIAGIGAVVGFGYSIYHNGWKLVLPTWSRDRAKNTIAVDNFGFLDEMVFATIAAVVTTLTSSAPSADGQWLVVKPATLQGGMVLSAIVAGIVGARMRSGIWDSGVLRQALASAAESVAIPGAKAAVLNAPTAAAAAEAGAGMTMPGGATSAAAARTEAALLQMFDQDKLNRRLVDQGKPIGPDGDGLTLETLDQFQPLVKNLKPFVKDMSLRDVSAMSLDGFLDAVTKSGVDAGTARPAFQAIHKAAVDTMPLLRAMPANWTFRTRQP